MCNCKNIEVGSYDNQVVLKNWWNGKSVCVDKCLVEEIKYLWENKIITTGCCCGHNVHRGYINVRKEDHNKMISLKYLYWFNDFGIECYVPKTEKN